MTFPFPTLIMATHNKGKLRELQMRLAQEPIEVMGLDDLPLEAPDVEETGSTLTENAILKATSYGWLTGAPCLADDSGLAVDALGGAPGVYSARFAGEGADDSDNNALLLERLKSVPDDARSARFCCCLALYIPAGPLAAELAAALKPGVGVEMKAPHSCHASDFDPVNDGAVFVATGVTMGQILHAPRGTEGFGYDPLFLSRDLGLTFAEAFESKKGVSHRARALDTLLGWLGEISR